MKLLHPNAPIKLSSATYLTLLIFLAPLLNFLAGMTLDIYSPSMPIIANYFHASVTETKNTISVTLFGWGIGALIFGTLMDSIGRKKILIYGLLGYIISSFLAAQSTSIEQFLIFRLLQGVVIAGISVASRAIIVDTVTGKRYNIAILYTSIGYALGPILGPLLGGYLQEYISWRADFYALMLIASILLVLCVLFYSESLQADETRRQTKLTTRFGKILENRKFLIGAVILSVMQIQLMIYPTIGSFIIEDRLHKSVLFFADSALAVACCYLLGALANRFLLKKLTPKAITDLGCIVLAIGTLLFLLLSQFTGLSVTTILAPTMIICVSTGMIFPNVLATNLKTAPKAIGLLMAVQASILLFLSSIGIFIVSNMKITGLTRIGEIFSILTLIEIGLLFLVYRKLFNQTLTDSVASATVSMASVENKS